MSRPLPERYVWAVDLLDVQPTDVILEIGCGYGHSIPLICPRLTKGFLTAVDRSRRMTEAAARAHAEFIASGKAEILNLDLLEAVLPLGHFDKVFLFNINAFWMDPRSELAEIRRLLKPNGQFFLFHQPPPGHDLDEFENAFRTNLSKHAFLLLDVFKEPREPIRSVAVIAAPSPQ